METRRAVETGRSPEPRLLYTEDELREFRKLQEIALWERDQARVSDRRSRVEGVQPGR